MYSYWKTRNNFGFVYNDYYAYTYHYLLPITKDIFYEYYTRKVLRNSDKNKVDISNALYWSIYNKTCKYKLIEMFSGMTYKEYVLKSLLRIKMILTHKAITGYNVTFDYFKHVFQNPLEYEILDWDVALKENKHTGEHNVLVYNIKYNVYDYPKNSLKN